MRRDTVIRFESRLSPHLRHSLGHQNTTASWKLMLSESIKGRGSAVKRNMLKTQELCDCCCNGTEYVLGLLWLTD
jgi:hypothetical protein